MAKRITVSISFSRLISAEIACETLMIEGRAHFLLCHFHPAVATRLTPESFRSIEVGQDALVPVATPQLLKASKPGSLPYLAYTAESQPGRFLAAAWASAGQHPRGRRPGRCGGLPTFDRRFEDEGEIARARGGFDPVARGAGRI